MAREYIMLDIWANAVLYTTSLHYTGPVMMSNKKFSRSRNIPLKKGKIVVEYVTTMDWKGRDNNILYHNIELKLDDIASKLLLSNDNNHLVLSEVQQIVESVFIGAALEITDNNLSRAAKMLGINRNTLSRKVAALANRSC
jgi:DNA-binding protein Fis